MNIKRLHTAALLLVIALVSAACSTTTSEASVSGDDLPFVEIFQDEDGPGDVPGIVTEAELIFEGRVVEVIPGLRFYGGFDPEIGEDFRTFEDIGLVIETTNVLKGDVPERITVRWPGYLREAGDLGAQRTGQLTVNGLTINENARGQNFGVLTDPLTDPGDYIPLTTSGIIPLNSNGRITGRNGFGRGTTIFGDFVGERLSDVVDSAR